IGLAAGNQIGVIVLLLVGIMPGDHIENLEAGRNRLMGKQLLEHAAIASVLLDELRSQVVGFQNTDTQGMGALGHGGYCLNLLGRWVREPAGAGWTWRSAPVYQPANAGWPG